MSLEAAEQPKLPAQILRDLYLERKAKNPAYSTRAFARDIGMSQTLLSLVMNCKRPLTIKQCAQISVLLGLPQDQAERFVELTTLALPENAKAARSLRKMRLKKLAERQAVHSSTLTIPRHLLPEAELKLQRFQQELAAMLGQNSCEGAFELNIRILPFSNT